MDVEIGMKRRRVALSVAVIASGLASALMGSTDAVAEPRGVVELFTSQGCSSCPPADKLAGELARDPSLVVLSLPIDYWDYLGWKDTLALPGHANRQRAYSKVRGDREVYTPQVVVNGAVHTLGSDKGAIENAIAQTRKQDGTLSLPLSMSIANDSVAITIPAANNAAQGGAAQKAEVWLCPITRDVTVSIGRGENTGHTVTYHNVVRRWVKLGDWNGSARSFTVPLRDVTSVGGDAVAVVVQSGTKEAPGNMLGAALAALK
jgi:hypothetical protein